MASAQILLSEYLQYELYHSIGAYSVARDSLADLADRMERNSTPRVGEVAEHEARARERETREKSKLLDVTRLSHQYNDMLVRQRHFAHRAASTASPVVRPVPGEFPLTLSRRFQIEQSADVEDARRNPWARPLGWAWVLNFYDAAIASIDVVENRDRKKKLKETNIQAANLVKPFATSMTLPRDNPPRSRQTDTDRERRRRWLRKARFQARLEMALDQLPGIPRETPHRSDDATEFIPRLATDNLGSGAGSVPLFVICALAEAHLTHHAVEAWLSMSFEAHAQYAAPHLVAHSDDGAEDGESKWNPSDWLHKELDRCIVLDTFAYSASRCAPWMFAADDDECKQVFGDCQEAWTNAVPTRCMWISAQVSLLALHRRAYSYALKGERVQAYNDYHKLQRQIRVARRRMNDAPLHIAGAHDFLTCLEARANQNIGELYRSEHAQQPALKHFQTALECLRTIKRTEMDAVLTNSRWQVELKISRGKASYEMGKHKQALRWHLEGWKAFLELMAADTHTETSTEAIDSAIAWLDTVKLEPELRKDELQRHLRPVVDQLDRIKVDQQYGGLAAEILLRLGHVLLVLRLGLTGASRGPAGDRLERGECRERFAETLMFPCLKKAAQCDPHSTLIAADLLKARLRLANWLREEPSKRNPRCEKELELPEMAAIVNQWPQGGDNYTRISRVAEYLTLVSLDPDTAVAWEHEPRSRKDEILLARSLLLNVFMHTDSINVRKAQTHRYLMLGRAPANPPKDVPRKMTRKKQGARDHEKSKILCPWEKAGEIVEPAIELICMRRYSSAFPLLPRPSAFRAHGGGYFVRLHPRRLAPKKKVLSATETGDDDSKHDHRCPRCSEGDKRLREKPRDPIGIVVDPGPDFIENLYRTGLSLGDIDMIVVTHDHVDHLNSLESLLSLLNYRDNLLTDQGATEDRPTLRIYGNESIIKRYRNVGRLKPDRFKPLTKIDKEKLLRRPGFAGFTISAMSSREVDGVGHLDLSYQPSYGISFRHEHNNLSLAITSDTPAPPGRSEKGRKRWIEEWRHALQADVLVAHMSTVPLAELRQIAKLDARLSVPGRDVSALDQQIGEVKGRIDGTLGRIDFDIDIKNRAIKEKGASEKPGYRAAVDELAAVRKSHRRVRELSTALERLQKRLSRLPAKRSKHRVVQVMSDVRRAGKKVVRRSKALRGALERTRHEPVLHDELSRLALDAQALGQKAHSPSCDAEALERIRTQLQAHDEHLRGRVEFSMWLRSRDTGPTADLVGLVDSDPNKPARYWRPPQEHPYLKGTLEWARAYRRARKKAYRKTANGLFVLGELSEELGTARGKIAGEINRTLFKPKLNPKRRKGKRRARDERPERPFSALTSDVGLRIFIVSAATDGRPPADRRGKTGGRRSSARRRRHTEKDAAQRRGAARILCTTCELDTDRVPDERYHRADCVCEVCVKGENEGIFYNCSHHDPGAEGLFLEQLERFDVFGR